MPRFNIVYTVSSFYRFHALDALLLNELRAQLMAPAQQLDLCGLILLSKEGVNGTIAGSAQSVERYKQLLSEQIGQGDYCFKDNLCQIKPYRRFKIDLRKELITCDDQIDPAKQQATHKKLTASEWHQALINEDVLVLDTRNKYETELGSFKRAIDPKIDKFTEFAQFVSQSQIDKNKKILMYCTGGIRCEKAALVMEKQGYKNVFQLEGGILRYLEQYPDGFFEGECFVFDHRVAVTNELKPSARYKLCPLCGDPGETQITCEYCGKQVVTCDKCCHPHQSCSKNCRHHIQRKLEKSQVANLS